jgi:hypothetical protein
MYYDRTLPERYVVLLREQPFFRMVLGLVRSPWGGQVLAHVEFRRSQGRKWGSVKLYAGRSSLLEIIANADDTFTLSADDKYTATATDLFGPRFSSAELNEITAAVEKYLRDVCSSVGTQFTGGEGRVHAGFVRRYGLDHQVSDCFLALDKEVRVGFAAKAETATFESELCQRFGKAHRELDSIGVLAAGNVALVELKKEKESMEVAAIQAATHVFTFRRLTNEQEQREQSLDLGRTIKLLVEQKKSVGLLPEHAFEASAGAALVPVIAAPDTRRDWETQWRLGLRQVMERHGNLLAGLRLWKLSSEGVIEEDVVA